MMAFGLVARCDSGGLARQTHDLYRHLRPDKTMVVRVIQPRGVEYLRMYEGPDVTVLPQWPKITYEAAAEFAEGLDHILTVECTYGKAFDPLPVEVTIVANPELWRSDDHRYDQVVAPTPWETHRLPSCVRVLPHPTSRWPDSTRIRTEVNTFLHPAAPAMLDRAGTEVVLHACSLMTEPANLIVRSPGRTSPDARGARFKLGRVSVRWESDWRRDWWDNYPVEADCLVLPRRYGGLSLPTQEAASLGLPNVMTDLEPQKYWPGWRISPGGSRPYRMRGGAFNVYRPEPVALAALMDDLVRGELDVASESRACLSWAKAISWDALGDDWRDVCGSTL